ncbi:MAG: FkbM family methyltransferase [Rhodospirillaceae bacterium]
MDKAAIYEFLSFLGGARSFRPLRMDWNLSQLQFAGLHFGLTAEDAAIRQHFKPRVGSGVHGAYVDIGAFRPANISNTYLFYLMGWRGLAIDPSEEAAAQWRTVRPEDTFIRAAVGEIEGTAYWFRHNVNAGTSVTRATNDKPEGNYADGVAVDMIRLDQMLDKYLAGRAIQIMSLDIEGGELGALRSNDWCRWRPELIIMEAHGFDMMAPRAFPTVSYLIERGYLLEAKVGANVIMLDGQTPSPA